MNKKLWLVGSMIILASVHLQGAGVACGHTTLRVTGVTTSSLDQYMGKTGKICDPGCPSKTTYKNVLLQLSNCVMLKGDHPCHEGDGFIVRKATSLDACVAVPLIQQKIIEDFACRWSKATAPSCSSSSISSSKTSEL